MAASRWTGCAHWGSGRDRPRDFQLRRHARLSAGAIPRCESALGLTEVADPLTEWYSLSDWRVMVSGMRRLPGETTGRQASIDACVEDNIPKECELRFMRERAIPRPLDMATRHTLIGLALEVGGPKAFDRMTAATGTAGDILAATSGVGIDELVARWRMRGCSPRRRKT